MSKDTLKSKIFQAWEKNKDKIEDKKGFQTNCVDLLEMYDEYAEEHSHESALEKGLTGLNDLVADFTDE